MSSLKNISFYTAIGVFTSGISFLLLPVLTKYLSPEDYGTLAIFNATTRFVIVFISLGTLHIAMVKMVEEEFTVFRQYFQSSNFISILASFFFFIPAIIIFFSVDSFFGLPSWLVLSIPGIALLVHLFDSVLTLKTYQKKIKEFVVLSLSKFFMEIAVSLFLIVYLAFDWKGRFFGLFISLIIGLSIGYVVFRRENLLKWSVNWNTSKELIRMGAPLIFLNLGIMVMNLSDRFFIEKMEGVSETGIYSIASAVGGIQLLVVGASMAVFRPKIYENIKHKVNTFKIQILNLGLLVGVFIGLNLFSYSLFEIFIDEKYWAAKAYVFSISLGFVFWGVFNFYISYYMYFKKTSLTAVISIVGVASNLFLNYVLIEEYSTIGAAYATAITYFVMALIIFMVFVFSPPPQVNDIS